MQSTKTDAQAVNTVQEICEKPDIHSTPATLAIAEDLRLTRAMTGPLTLRQAAAGLIHLALNTEQNAWTKHSQAVDLAGQSAALRLCRYAMGEIQRAISQSAADTLRHHRIEIRGIERAVATPEEATAKIYWEAMEKMDAAGIDFEQLLSYHYASDAETEL